MLIKSREFHLVIVSVMASARAVLSGILDVALDTAVL
jgi:hypothetical protein